jgi:hypothetical protein
MARDDDGSDGTAVSMLGEIGIVLSVMNAVFTSAGLCIQKSIQV